MIRWESKPITRYNKDLFKHKLQEKGLDRLYSLGYLYLVKLVQVFRLKKDIYENDIHTDKIGNFIDYFNYLLRFFKFFHFNVD